MPLTSKHSAFKVICMGVKKNEFRSAFISVRFPPPLLLRTFMSGYKIYCESCGLCFVCEWGSPARLGPAPPPSLCINESDVKERVPAFDNAQGWRSELNSCLKRYHALTMVWNAHNRCQKRKGGVKKKKHHGISVVGSLRSLQFCLVKSRSISFWDS